MNLSSIVSLIFIVLIGIYSFVFLDLNQDVVNLDLLFFELDFKLGYIILTSTLLGILITIALEIIFFSSKRKSKDE